jgi:uroporphyrinogen-III synthase
VSRQRVLVLRPEPGASETAARLAAAGFDPVVMPLSEIRPLGPIADIDPARIGCVAATSANALRHAPPTLSGPVLEKPLFAVGAATAQAARAAGFSAVKTGSDDGEELAGMILENRPEGAVLYLCGKVRRPEFEQILLRNGQDVAPIEVYDAVPISRRAEFAAISSDGSPLVALCHSPEAARMLAQLIEGIAGLAERTRVIAISPRAALPLAAIGVAVDVASKPTDQAMLALLN